MWLASLRSVLNCSAVCMERFDYTCPFSAKSPSKRMLTVFCNENSKLELPGVAKLSVMRGIFYSVRANGDYISVRCTE